MYYASQYTDLKEDLLKILYKFMVEKAKKLEKKKDDENISQQYKSNNVEERKSSDQFSQNQIQNTNNSLQRSESMFESPPKMDFKSLINDKP